MSAFCMEVVICQETDQINKILIYRKMEVRIWI